MQPAWERGVDVMITHAWKFFQLGVISPELFSASAADCMPRGSCFVMLRKPALQPTQVVFRAAQRALPLLVRHCAGKKNENGKSQLDKKNLN
jgi:hypothetical protein